MSKKRRTKKQKRQRSQRQLISSPLASRPDSTSAESEAQFSLFRYDQRLIYRDLLRSLVITAMIFLLLFGIYFWLK